MNYLLDFMQANLNLSLSFLFVLIAYIGFEILSSGGDGSSMSASEAVVKYNHEGATIVDIRTDDEYLKSHAIGSIHIKSLKVKVKKKSNTIILLGYSDKDAIKTMHKLNSEGYTEVKYIKGGMNSWIESELMVINNATDKKVSSKKAASNSSAKKDNIDNTNKKSTKSVAANSSTKSNKTKMDNKSKPANDK